MPWNKIRKSSTTATKQCHPWSSKSSSWERKQQWNSETVWEMPYRETLDPLTIIPTMGQIMSHGIWDPYISKRNGEHCRKEIVKVWEMNNEAVKPHPSEGKKASLLPILRRGPIHSLFPTWGEGMYPKKVSGCRMLHKTQKSGIKTEPKFPNKKRHQMEACPPNSAGETTRNK